MIVSFVENGTNSMETSDENNIKYINIFRLKTIFPGETSKIIF